MMNIHVFIKALSEWSLHHVPEGIDGCTCEHEGEERHNTTRNAESHDDIYRDSCFFDGKDASVLRQDGNFGEGETHTVCEDAPIEILQRSGS
jgi:hypothetical protein